MAVPPGQVIALRLIMCPKRYFHDTLYQLLFPLPVFNCGNLCESIIYLAVNALSYFLSCMTLVPFQFEMQNTIQGVLSYP